MDRLDIAIDLIREAREERKRLAKMETEIDLIPMSAPDYWKRRYDIEAKYTPMPHKSVINDNLKIARRILLGEYEKG